MLEPHPDFIGINEVPYALEPSLGKVFLMFLANKDVLKKPGLMCGDIQDNFGLSTFIGELLEDRIKFTVRESTSEGDIPKFYNGMKKGDRFVGSWEVPEMNKPKGTGASDSMIVELYTNFISKVRRDDMSPIASYIIESKINSLRSAYDRAKRSALYRMIGRPAPTKVA